MLDKNKKTKKPKKLIKSIIVQQPTADPTVSAAKFYKKIFASCTHLTLSNSTLTHTNAGFAVTNEIRPRAARIQKQLVLVAWPKRGVCLK